MVILDEKFVIIAFIAVKKPNVLYLKEPSGKHGRGPFQNRKYINGEEALLSKQRSSSTQKEKSRGDKKREQTPKRQADWDRSLRRRRENSEWSSIR